MKTSTETDTHGHFCDICYLHEARSSGGGDGTRDVLLLRPLDVCEDEECQAIAKAMHPALPPHDPAAYALELQRRVERVRLLRGAEHAALASAATSALVPILPGLIQDPDGRLREKLEEAKAKAKREGKG